MNTRGAIKGIELAFENVTVQFIPVEYIDFMKIRKVSESIMRPWAWGENLSTSKSCGEFSIILSHEMKDMIFNEHGKESELENNETVFERITKFQDIVSVTLKYKDDTEEEIYIPWEDKDGDDETNGLLTFEYDNGNLLIEAKER